MAAVIPRVGEKRFESVAAAAHRGASLLVSARMNLGRTVFAQLMDFLPHPVFDACVARYHGNHRVRRFSCRDQFLVMAFAQLTYRESLRDIEACLRAMPERLYHAGIRGPLSRSTLADANERRDWRIYQDIGMALIAEARALYADTALELGFEQTVFAFDSTMIELCLSLFPWATYRPGEAGIKVHTLLDLRGPIPTLVRVTPAQLHDVNGLDLITIEAGAMYVFDRGYLDFGRLFRITQTPASFVIRGRQRHSLRRLASHPVDRTTGVLCDQRVLLTRPRPAAKYPLPLRRIRFNVPAVGERAAQHLTLFTNHFGLPALTITDLYHRRWQVELFFKWIKQHLRIKAFYGTSVNAVKTQIWIALSVYVLVAIVVKRLGIRRDFHAVLQILSLTLFEKVPLQQVLTATAAPIDANAARNQLLLFDF